MLKTVCCSKVRYYNCLAKWHIELYQIAVFRIVNVSLTDAVASGTSLVASLASACESSYGVCTYGIISAVIRIKVALVDICVHDVNVLYIDECYLYMIAWTKQYADTNATLLPTIAYIIIDATHTTVLLLPTLAYD